MSGSDHIEKCVTVARQPIANLPVVSLPRGQMDNRTGFIATAGAEWVAEHGSVYAFIPPVQPWHHRFVASFSNEMRDELLSENLFNDVGHVMELGSWRTGRDDTRNPRHAHGYRSLNAYAEQWKKCNADPA